MNNRNCGDGRIVICRSVTGRVSFVRVSPCSRFAIFDPAIAAARASIPVKAHYTKYEYRIPMRDGVRLFTAVYVPKDTSQPYPILLTRTPYSVGPYGVDEYRGRTSGPSPLFARRATSSSTRTCAAAGCPRASSSTCGRTIRARSGPQDIDESTDTYDTIDWLLKNVPEQQRQGRACGASRIPASTPRPA